jgi:hypothetical protein
MVKNAMHTIGQKEVDGHMRNCASIHDVAGQGRNLCKSPWMYHDGGQRQKRTWSELGTHWQGYAAQLE